MIVVSGSLAYIAQYSYIFGLIFKHHKIPQGLCGYKYYKKPLILWDQGFNLVWSHCDNLQQLGVQIKAF